MVNGEDTKFWEDTWLNDVALKVKFPRIYALELEKNVSVAYKKKDSTLALSFITHLEKGLKTTNLISYNPLL